MKKEQNKNTKEKKRVIKHASDLKAGEILLFNDIEFDPDIAEIILTYDGMLVDRFRFIELLDVAIPNTYEYQEGEKMIEESNDLKAFKEFLEKNGMVPAGILQTQLNDYHRQSDSMKNVLHELIERTQGKANLREEERAVFCLLGWIDEAFILKAVVESHQPIDEVNICKLTHLPKKMVRRILKKLIEEGSINRNSIKFFND